MQRVMVTGGAGFIGSHLVDRLVEEGFGVRVIDNLSNSPLEHIKNHIENDNIDFHEQDLKNNPSPLFEKIDTVFHFAASSDVRKGNKVPRKMYENNVLGTFNVLEACRKKDVDEIVFASTSTVYGNADEIPTPETHDIKPVSLYGSTKAAAENLIKSYTDLYDTNTTVLRYANIFGPRSDHGVMHDFFHKLKENPKELEILGDGKQKKSYLYIDDCLEATLLAWRKSEDNYNIFNVSSNSQITVNQIADCVANAMNLNKVDYEYTGGSKGWKGDVPAMLLDNSKIKDLGWKPKINVKEGIQKYIEWLSKNK